LGGLVSVRKLRERQETHGESGQARDGPDATRVLILRWIAVLHIVLLMRVLRGFLCENGKRREALPVPGFVLCGATACA
jgi:hypothetical protein